MPWIPKFGYNFYYSHLKGSLGNMGAQPKPHSQVSVLAIGLKLKEHSR